MQCSCALLLLVGLHAVIGSYVITTPRKWTSGSRSQVCMTYAVSERAPTDQITVTVYSQERDDPPKFGGWWGPPDDVTPIVKTLLIPAKVLKPHGDSPTTCDQLSVPGTAHEFGKVEIVGQLGGVDINVTKNIGIATNVGQTFVQTDKFLYKAGQKVQFRVLSLKGPFFAVSTEPYPEIYVENPSGSRIAQWLDVQNPSGLVHLDLQLIDEPEEGTYSIKVRSAVSPTTTVKNFKIEDYVLPRFEVSLKLPKYLLASDEILSFEVCATYTFGQPVKGDVKINIRNDGWGRHVLEMNLLHKLSGCRQLEIPVRTFNINNRQRFVHRISVDVEVEEEGTGSTASDAASVPITRTVISMTDVGTRAFKKADLPFSNTIKAEFPDGRPASLEPMSVCLKQSCRNMTTTSEGLLQYTIPPHLIDDTANVIALNYPRRTLDESSHRAFMFLSEYRTYGGSYYSPTDSSLLISPETTSLNCTGRESFHLQVPVMFAAVNTTEAMLHVQVVSRGQIQFWTSQSVQFTAGPLAIDEASLVAPIQPLASPFRVRGTVTLPITLPSTVSPSVKILVWYNRADGEVVSDARELVVSKCLDHQVQLSWPTDKVEQGTTLPLTLTAEPNSLCSLGIVDKSVELLSASEDSLTLEKVFDLAERATVGSWENSQIDDYEYCRNKESSNAEEVTEGPLDEPPPPPPFFDDLMIDDEPAPLVLASTTEHQSEDKPSASGAGPAAEDAAPTLDRTKRSFMPYPPFGGTGKVDALKMFDDSGLYIISDLTYETRPCRRYPAYNVYNRVAYASPNVRVQQDFGIMAMSAAAGPPQPFAGVALNSPGNENFASDDATATKSRTYFPETWLWELATIEPSGTLSQELSLPNTITEWVGRAVCVHPSKGLGISTPTSITTFTSFFIDLTILPTIKKGEIMPVKISVFNYLTDSLPVRITLEESLEYDILGENGTEVQTLAGVRSVCIPTQDKQTVIVRVRPQKVGAVNVTVSAVVDASAAGQCGPEVTVDKVDRIITPITVEYEGFPREKTWSKYMCSEDLHENLDFFEEWRLEAPEGIVPESERAWLTVVGDLLGPTLENLGNLIRMPYGCGEQNMLNFAPNIYVLQYLEASGQATPAATDKITAFMTSGYQRELNYKHRDGSYSAFGESDNSGSTWLTAFVVKSFAQARQYISVDATELAMSTDWLKLQQLENGCFESVGKVLHKGMKGGLSEGSNPAVLSAYVMAALLEAGEDPNGVVVPNAVYCLLGASRNTSRARGAYELALTAYALSLGNLPEADQAMSDLLAASVETSAGLYWEMPTSVSSDHGRSGNPAMAVETAGYALLAVMAVMGRNTDLYKPKAHKLVKWISTQRNSQGGFISTQDTVVALQALAMYEMEQDQGPLDLTVIANGPNLTAMFQVDESNKLLTQRAEVPSVPSNILLDMAGTGCTLVQAVVRYNVKDAEPSEAFSLSVSTSIDYTKDSCKTRKIRTCAAYLLNDLVSNMAVIEVTLVSGYIPDKADLKRVVGYGTGIIKRYEVDGNKVMFYIDQFTADEICVEFSIIQEVEVENAKPGTVKVYDYYEPEFHVSEKYQLAGSAWHCRRPVILAEPPLIDVGDIITDIPILEVVAASSTEGVQALDIAVEP